MTQAPRPHRRPASGALPPLFQGGADPVDLFGLLDQMLQKGSAWGRSPAWASRRRARRPRYRRFAAPAGLQGQDYYAEASVDKATPYQGEQVLYTLRFYRALDPFGRIEYKAPAFSGAWSKPLPDQTNYTTQAGGRNYLVTELQHVLFPTVAGEVVIDPSRLTLPGDFLGAPGIEVASQPLTLDVQPLPAGAPASFQGAVGQFTLESEVDKAEAKVGDAITQRVTISGAGNIEQVADPLRPEDSAWRAFDSQSTTDSQFQDGQLVGVRRIEQVLVPTQPGQLTPAGRRV